ncbi:hypothetical protein BC829DRAFT_53455 [Chytridium lagenaria]|nr:hypothetical protein BC829DRAFT_53455 [Chytridium lagenaria]
MAIILSCTLMQTTVSASNSPAPAPARLMKRFGGFPLPSSSKKTTTTTTVARTTTTVARTTTTTTTVVLHRCSFTYRRRPWCQGLPSVRQRWSTLAWHA